MAEPAAKQWPPTFACRDCVEAQIGSHTKHYPGVVERVNANGASFVVAYNDGNFETHVPVARVHVFG